MGFFYLFLIAFTGIGLYKLGKVRGRIIECREWNEKFNEVADKLKTPLADRTIKRRITLLGGPISGAVIRFDEAELARHKNQIQITAALPDGSEFEGIYEVQGDVGIHVDREVTK